MPAGRPTEISDVKIQKLEQAFALDATIKEACFYADISKSTLYNYQKENPSFLERKEALKEQPVLKARKVVIDAIESGDKQSSQWLLERRKKSEFSLKTEQEHTGANGGPIQIDAVLNSTDQEILDRFYKTNYKGAVDAKGNKEEDTDTKA